METFDLFDTKNGSDEVLMVASLKMDHLYFKINQIEIQFKEAPKSNFLLLLFDLYTIFFLLYIIFYFVNVLMLYLILCCFLRTFNLYRSSIATDDISIL